MSQREPVEFSEPLQFMCPISLKTWLRDYSADYSMSMGAIIRLALHQFRRQEGSVREAVIAREDGR
jgi:hypothetical protein